MYGTRHYLRVRRPPRPDRGWDGRGAASIWVAGGLAVVLLLGAGVVYRTALTRLDAPVPVNPPVSLAEIPTTVEGWTSETLAIPSITDEYMRSNFADDYISRRYVNEDQRMWADAYVVYCSSRPAGMLGHRPEVCFPAHGWIHDETSQSEFQTHLGRRMPVLVHRFHKQSPDYGRVVILNFYVLNGEVTLREGDFSGFFGRRPNVSSNPARYVAQIQISSSSEHAARALVASLTDSILAILPDQNGRVTWTAAQETSSRSDAETQENH